MPAYCQPATGLYGAEMHTNLPLSRLQDWLQPLLHFSPTATPPSSRQPMLSDGDASLAYAVRRGHIPGLCGFRESRIHSKQPHGTRYLRSQLPCAVLPRELEADVVHQLLEVRSVGWLSTSPKNAEAAELLTS